MARNSIDHLYRLPLEEFTGARNELARKLSKSGKKEEARSIRERPRPVRSAWVVNQLWWSHRRSFRSLLAAGERLRAIQSSGAGSAEELRAADERRRRALATLVVRAEELLEESGQRGTRNLLRRVESNLDAIATLAGLEGAPEPGRMDRDLDPPGFETLLALSAGRPRSRKMPAPKKPQGPNRKEIERAGRLLERARRQRQRRSEEAAEAGSAQTRARERAEDVRRQIQLARSRLRLAEKHARRATGELNRATARKRRADEALTRADDLLARAETALTRAKKG